MVAGQASELSAALLEVLRDCNVHEGLRQALQQQELLTVEDFAYAFPTLSHLDSLFSNLDKEVKSSQAEAQLLSAALFDDTPEMTVQHGAVTAAEPFRNAWALCGAAHLRNLKAFDHFDQLDLRRQTAKSGI